MFLLPSSGPDDCRPTSFMMSLISSLDIVTTVAAATGLHCRRIVSMMA